MVSPDVLFQKQNHTRGRFTAPVQRFSCDLRPEAGFVAHVQWTCSDLRHKAGTKNVSPQASAVLHGKLGID